MIVAPAPSNAWPSNSMLDLHAISSPSSFARWAPLEDFSSIWCLIWAWDICIWPYVHISGRRSRHHQVGLPPPCQSLGTSKKIITPPTLLFTSNHCLGTLASPPSPLSHGILGILPISTEKPTRGVHITRFKVSMNGFKPWCLGWSHNIYLIAEQAIFTLDRLSSS